MAWLVWTKGVGEAMTAVAGPFVLAIEPKGDGRWSWRVTKGAANPTAVGIARSREAAKSVAEQFVKRSGVV
jgi:hypothetical protein